MGLNVALAFALIAGIILAGYGSATGAWTAYVLSIPFMVFVLPYFLGVVLLGGETSGRDLHLNNLAACTKGAGLVEEAKWAAHVYVVTSATAKPASMKLEEA